MGRPARPAQLKLLNGRTHDTDSGGRKVAAPPALARSAPDAPDWLDDEARAEWDRIIPELTRLRLISTIARGTVAAYCVCWSQFVQTYERWRAGRCSDKTLQDASTQLRQWAGQFGMTPATEGALHPPELPDLDDPFA